MDLLTILCSVVAANTFSYLLEQGRDFLVGKSVDKIWNALTGSQTTFKGELEKVVNEAINVYHELSPTPETAHQIPFYKSEALLTALLNRKFSQNNDLTQISAALEADTRILPTTRTELENFIRILDERIAFNPFLHDLNIEYNYKKGSFRDITATFREMG